MIVLGPSPKSAKACRSLVSSATLEWVYLVEIPSEQGPKICWAFAVSPKIVRETEPHDSPCMRSVCVCLQEELAEGEEEEGGEEKADVTR